GIAVPWAVGVGMTRSARPRGRGDPVFAKAGLLSFLRWIPAFAGMSGYLRALSHQSLLAGVGKAVVECTPQPLDQLVDLGFVNDQRRADRNRVAHGADDDAVLERAVLNEIAKAALRIEPLLGRLVLGQLDRADETNAAGVADQRMVLQCAQAFLQPRRHLLDVVDDLALLVDLQRLQR